MNWICLNGEILPQKHSKLDFENRAFRYGEALVEEMRSTGIRVPFFKEHFRRLEKGLSVLGISHVSSFSESELLRSIELLIHRNKLYSINKVTLTCWRADDKKSFSLKSELNYLVEVESIDEKQFTLNDKGWVIDVFSGAYKARSYLSPFRTNEKSFNYQAYRFAHINKLDTCLIVNPEGNIVEEIEGNVFYINGKTIYTPSLDSGCFEGIIRSKIIELAENDDYVIYETDALPPAFILEVEEIFVTNDLWGIRWVGGYKNKRYRKRRCVDFLKQINKLFE